MKKSIFLIAFSLAAMACSQSSAPKSGYGIGDIAMDFDLTGVDGKQYSYASFPDAKGYIVIFTCNHCPYAKAYEDRIIALNDKFASKGFPVIAINPNDPKIVEADNMENMKIRAQEKGFTFPYLMDETQDVYRAFGADKTPHVFVLQKTEQGNIVRYIGAIDDNYEDASAVTKTYVEDAVNAILNGGEIKVATTKAIGCSIKDNKK